MSVRSTAGATPHLAGTMAAEEDPDTVPPSAGPPHRPHDQACPRNPSADGDELPVRRPHSVLWGSLNRTADAALVGALSAGRLLAGAVRHRAGTGAHGSPGLAGG